MIGLPSLRALDGAQGARIWLAAEATDMRCGFDRLAERVKAVISQDPLSGHLFVFRSRRGAEDPNLGPRWLRVMVQAARIRSIQAASSEGRVALGGVATE
jgi:transposase